MLAELREYTYENSYYQSKIHSSTITEDEVVAYFNIFCVPKKHENRVEVGHKFRKENKMKR